MVFICLCNSLNKSIYPRHIQMHNIMRCFSYSAHISRISKFLKSNLVVLPFLHAKHRKYCFDKWQSPWERKSLTGVFSTYKHWTVTDVYNWILKRNQLNWSNWMIKLIGIIIWIYRCALNCGYRAIYAKKQILAYCGANLR